MRTIQYTNELLDLVVLHYQGLQKIGVMVRPKVEGDYLLKLTPNDFPDKAKKVALKFATSNDAPKTQLFDFSGDRISYNGSYLECILELEDASDHSLVTSSSFSLAWQNPNPAQDSTRFTFWSCHQPYKNNNKIADIDKNTNLILDWYEKKIHAFQPHTIWGAGDTAYSDGIKSTNFVKEIYNNPQWEEKHGADNLKDAYRNMYQNHWSFPNFSNVLRGFPHLFVWDDHEIIDGWGSHKNDKTSKNINLQADANQKMFQVAKAVAEEYILQAGPQVNPASGETHKSYVSGNLACFVFDTRSTRYYDRPKEEKLQRIISKQQLSDFEQFIKDCKANPEIRNVVVSTSTPFVHLKKHIMYLLRKFNPMQIKDDVRDAWGSEANMPTLKKVLGLLNELNNHREEINVFNFSGDVHVASAFEIYHNGSTKPIYQITSSALTNRHHPITFFDWISRLRKETTLPDIGKVKRIWKTVEDPNMICFTSKPDGFECALMVKNLSGKQNKHTEYADPKEFPIVYH